MLSHRRRRDHKGARGDVQRFVEITRAVTVKHGFLFAPPLRGGEGPAKAGTVIGHDGGAPVVTPRDGRVVAMPSQRRCGRVGRSPPADEVRAEAP